MKRYFWMLFTAVGMLVLASCGSEGDDKLAGFPWNDKELFSQVFTMDADGRCLLEGMDAISRQALDIYLVGYGWQPVGIYQVMEDGRLSKDDYREMLEEYCPKVYEFLSDEQMKTYYLDGDTREKCFKKQAWSYDGSQGVITRKVKLNHDEADKYLQVVDVKVSEDATYMYAVEKIGGRSGSDKQEKAVYALVVYQRLSDSELSNVKNTYTTDKSYKDDSVNIPDDCHYCIQCSYANPVGEYEKYERSKFQSFRLLKLELTDEKGNHSSSNPYYQYFDSIVWTCKGMPDRVVSLRNSTHGHEVAYSVNSYFFQLSKESIVGTATSTVLTSIKANGYKGGHVVYSSEIGITIMNQGFLGFDFSSEELLHPSPDDSFDLYSVFDQSKRYRVLSPRYSVEYPDKPYAELRYVATMLPSEKGEYDETSVEKALAEEKNELTDLMDIYYGQYGKGIVVDASNIEKYRHLFKALPADANIVMYWRALTPVSSNVRYAGSYVALVLERDKENPQKSCYYIHAEPMD